MANKMIRILKRDQSRLKNDTISIGIHVSDMIYGQHTFNRLMNYDATFKVISRTLNGIFTKGLN